MATENAPRHWWRSFGTAQGPNWTLRQYICEHCGACKTVNQSGVTVYRRAGDPAMLNDPPECLAAEEGR